MSRVRCLTTLSPDEAAGIQTGRRDEMRSIEADMRAKWAVEKTFENDNSSGTKEKYFCTFPYPYMNGRLHLGHAFTVTKADFAAGFHRLLGKQVLFPFAFHCTGMPIQAAANKLKREIEDFGIENCRSGVFDGGAAAKAREAKANAEVSDEKLLAMASAGPRGKKTKLVAKTGGITRQWTILQKNGILDEEIPKFVDAQYWLAYFPPYGMSDLKVRGMVDNYKSRHSALFLLLRREGF
jgi:leucyl-tRNA synthetase